MVAWVWFIIIKVTISMTDPVIKSIPDQKALALQKSFFGESHPELALNYINVGEVYFHQKEFQQAMEYYQKALDILQAVYGEEHPYIGIIYKGMGELYDAQGDYAQAKKYYRKALGILKSVLDETSPMIKDIENSLEMLQEKKKAKAPGKENSRQ